MRKLFLLLKSFFKNDVEQRYFCHVPKCDDCGGDCFKVESTYISGVYCPECFKLIKEED